jgi:hypothetical protein
VKNYNIIKNCNKRDESVTGINIILMQENDQKLTIKISIPWKFYTSPLYITLRFQDGTNATFNWVHTGIFSIINPVLTWHGAFSTPGLNSARLIGLKFQLFL